MRAATSTSESFSVEAYAKGGKVIWARVNIFFLFSKKGRHVRERERENENEEEGRKKAYTLKIHCDQVGGRWLSDSFPNFFKFRATMETAGKKFLYIQTHSKHSRMDEEKSSGETESCRVAWWSTLSLSEVLETLGVFPFSYIIRILTQRKSNGSTFIQCGRSQWLFIDSAFGATRSLPLLLTFRMHTRTLKHEMEIFLQLEDLPGYTLTEKRNKISF